MTQPLENAPTNAPPRLGWGARTRHALAFGATDTDTILVALAGFLLRGGIVLVLLPSAVLPSAIGIASITGVAAFGIDGHPTAWLFEVVAIIAALTALWLVLAFVVGSLVDVWLIDVVVDKEGHATRRPGSLPDLRILLDLAAIRALCVLPVGVAIYFAGSSIYASAYRELTTPSNLATPLALRVMVGAADAVFALILVWLASEVVGAIAVRRLVLHDQGVPRSIAGALWQIARRPVSSVSTTVVSFGTSAIAMAAAIVATATAFDWCLAAARGQQAILVTIGVSPLSTTRDFRPVVFLFAAFALALAWVVALSIAGITSAWRSSAFTFETADALAEVRPASAGAAVGLSGPATER